MLIDVIQENGEVRRSRLEDFFAENRHLVWGHQNAYVAALRRDGETHCCGATLRVVNRRRSHYEPGPVREPLNASAAGRPS